MLTTMAAGQVGDKMGDVSPSFFVKDAVLAQRQNIIEPTDEMIFHHPVGECGYGHQPN